jgi:hypothetical protein
VRLAGIFYCPRCLCRTRATLAAGAVAGEGEDLPDLECVECEYVWGTYYVEHANGPAEAKPTLDAEARRRGMELLLGRTQEYILRNGLPLENLTQPTSRIPRCNARD